MSKIQDDIEQTKEALSAYMDDALDEESKKALLAKLKDDPELQATWKRFHLIHNVMQQKIDPLLLGYGAMLSAKVSAALANEPAVVWGAEFDKPIVLNTAHINDDINATKQK
ncbi:MAG: sigma-E factor negative regulatory protein [Candidatus Berkiella sp.]